MSKKKKDYFAAAIFLCCSIALYCGAASFPIKKGTSIALNPGFYPQMLAVILAVLSIILIITTFLKKTDVKDEPMFKDRKSTILFIITVALLLLYPFILANIGFAVATFIFITSLTFTLSEDRKKKIPINLLVSLGTTTIIYLVFRVVLKIPFPTGVLF